MTPKQMIFQWYRDTFFPSEEGNDAFDFKRVYGLLSAFQKRYNAVAPKPCRGLSFMNICRAADKECYQPLCPSCWHRRAQDLFQVVSAAPQLGGYLYLRSTWFVRWDTRLHPAVLKRLKTRRTDCKMLGYTLSFDAANTKITDTDIVQDIFEGELSYRMLGLFRTEKPLREYHKDSAGQLTLYEGGDVIGVLDTAIVYDAVSEWLDNLGHPWLYHRHSVFDDYLTYFEPQVGRSWARANRKYLKEIQ